jgi:hypothetical protein
MEMNYSAIRVTGVEMAVMLQHNQLAVPVVAFLTNPISL